MREICNMNCAGLKAGEYLMALEMPRQITPPNALVD